MADKRRQYLSPAALKALMAKEAPYQANRAEKKKTSSKASKEKAATVKSAAEQESFGKIISKFSNTLSSGKLKTEAEMEVPAAQAPNKISENTSYHNGLFHVINDFDNRVSQVTKLSQKNQQKNLEEKATKMGVTVNNLPRTSTRGITETIVSKMNPSRSMIGRARSLLEQSWLAHHAGDHISAAEHFTNATDSVAAALRHVNSPQGLGSTDEYNILFQEPKYGQKNNPATIGGDIAAKLTAISNGYVDHTMTAGVESGKIHPNIAGEVKSTLNREYDTVLQPNYITKALGPAAVLTDEQKAAKEANKQAQKLRIAQNKSMQRAATGQHSFTIARELGDSDGPSDLALEGVAKYKEATRESLRTKRATVQPHFEAEEELNAKSAAEVGKKYVKKTFVGSAAHTDPDSWMSTNKRKKAWLAATPEARPEDFETSEAYHDPHKSSELSYTAGVKQAKSIDYKVNPKLKTTKLIFGEDIDSLRKGGEGISPTEGTFAPFYPTKEQSERADKLNEDRVPLDVEQKQLSSAKKAGTTLGRDQQINATTPQKTPSPTTRRGATSGKPISGEADLTPVVEAAVTQKRGLNVHFSDGAGK
jgi:hypothetical protein